MDNNNKHPIESPESLGYPTPQDHGDFTPEEWAAITSDLEMGLPPLLPKKNKSSSKRFLRQLDKSVGEIMLSFPTQQEALNFINSLSRETAQSILNGDLTQSDINVIVEDYKLKKRSEEDVRLSLWNKLSETI